MSPLAPSDQQRLHELLADRAVQGLEPEEQAELNALLAQAPELDDDSFERTAAAIDLSLSGSEFEPLPVHLSDRIAADAVGHLPSARKSADRPTRVARSAEQLSPIRRYREVVAWLVAAACLLVAVFAWRGGGERAVPLAEQREQLLDEADVIQVDWTATEDPAAREASGDVVWSNARQEGFLRLKGLAANDPQQNQYQLWIFDAQRDERHPVDGGVFDMAAGEVIIPIRARLQVHEPTLFAVTLEKPGGVVVSERGRLPLLAKVPS